MYGSNICLLLKKKKNFEDRTPQYIIWAENVYTMIS